MATYSSAAYTANTPAAMHGANSNVKCAYASVTCSASPATTDTINFFYLPAGARVIYSSLKASDMDTAGSPALTLNIGDAGSATRYYSASTVGQAGTAAVQTAVGAFDYANTAKTLVVGTAGTNAGTGAAGTVELMMLYVVEGAAS